MNYRNDRYQHPLSILGYGCMRFSMKNGKVDLDKTEEEIMYAYNHGVNYYDTAYIYPGSEAALGKILAKNNIREKVNIATKLPHYLIKSKDQLEKYFQEELSRLQTDYIDYYLMHMLTDVKTWQRLLDLGIKEWLEEKKQSGQIRQVGFSYHGNSEMFCQVLDIYDWDFCQIQYNYFDENSQAGRVGLNYAYSKGIPVIIMEPLRGGKLIKGLSKEAIQLISPMSPARFALNWLYDQKEVTVVLSGMNSLEMVKENISIASDASIGMIKDHTLYHEVVEDITSKMKVGCTGCRYCMPCPKNVDIPGVFSSYNAINLDGKFEAKIRYMMTSLLRKEHTSISNCIQCGKCESHCPQHIEIRNQLQKAKKELEGPLYQIVSKVIHLFMKY